MLLVKRSRKMFPWCELGGSGKKRSRLSGGGFYPLLHFLLKQEECCGVFCTYLHTSHPSHYYLCLVFSANKICADKSACKKDKGQVGKWVLVLPSCHAKNSPSSFLTASEQKHLEGEIISNSCFQTCFI